MTPEGKVKAAVKKLLAAHGAYVYMPVSNGMGAPALDFICSYHGKFLSIETKAGSKPMTPRQANTAKSIEAGGGVTFLINEHTGTSELERWLKDN